MIVAGGCSYIICRVFHGLPNAKILFDSVQKKIEFFPRSNPEIFQATVIRYGNRFSKNGYHHDDQREKLNNICEN